MNLRKDHCRYLSKTERPANKLSSLAVGRFLSRSRVHRILGFACPSEREISPGPVVRVADGYHNNTARKVSRNMQPNGQRSPSRRRCKRECCAAIKSLKRLSATDISALASMKNVAKCDTWCELQNPVNHRVFERKLRPKPSGRGHVCLGVTNRRPPHKILRVWDGSWSPVCYRTRLTKI